MGDATRLSRVSLKGSIAPIRGRARADDMHDSRLFLQSDEFFQQQATAFFIAYGSLVEPQLGDIGDLNHVSIIRCLRCYR
jgi:hypothetical protein